MRGHRAARQATLPPICGAARPRRRAGADDVDGDGARCLGKPARRSSSDRKQRRALVVVRTKASAASTVARALDEAHLEEVMGTIAGDDTIFVAPRRPGAGKAVARRLRAVLGLD